MICKALVPLAVSKDLGRAKAPTVHCIEYLDPSGCAGADVLLCVVPGRYSAGMGDPLERLAGYFHRKEKASPEDFTGLARAAREAGHTWSAMTAACGITEPGDMNDVAVAIQPFILVPDRLPELFYQSVSYAIEQLTRPARRYPPVTWHCGTCGRQVTDRAGAGRPIHVEHGHGPGCARLARDQGADDARRRAALPALVKASDPPCGQLQRHHLAEPIIEDCPRCGWRGYFHEHITTIDGDWATAVCDNCYDDLRPGVTVTACYYSASSGGREPFAVIRQRTHSDCEFPDTGQVMTWRLWWEHTPMLVEDSWGQCDAWLEKIPRGQAEQIMARLAATYWPPEAATLPWVRPPTPTRDGGDDRPGAPAEGHVLPGGGRLPWLHEQPCRGAVTSAGG